MPDEMTPDEIEARISALTPDQAAAIRDALVADQTRLLVDEVARQLPRPRSQPDDPVRLRRERDDARRRLVMAEDTIKAREERIGELERAVDRLFRAQNTPGRTNRGNR